jgi:hypothetical protein
MDLKQDLNDEFDANRNQSAPKVLATHSATALNRFNSNEDDGLDLGTLIKNEFNNEDHINFGCGFSKSSYMFPSLATATAASESNAQAQNTKSIIGMRSMGANASHTNSSNSSSDSNLVGMDNNNNNSSSSYTSENATIKIHEDDIIDEIKPLLDMYHQFYAEHECTCDPAQNLFAAKSVKLSKSLQRKLVTLHQMLAGHNSSAISASGYLEHIKNSSDVSALLNISMQNQEYKKKLFRLLRSIVERISIDAYQTCDQYHNQLQQQEQLQSPAASLSNGPVTNPNNPTVRLWNEVRERGCQFLGPQMQDDALKLILHALETVSRMSRKLLVYYVVYMLKRQYPKASKTSVGHVVQLLYRAGCFKMVKREGSTALMELKKEYSKYPALRRQHDQQIILIGLEVGIRMSPEQWSQKLFGDAQHKSEMQSIIDTLQSQLTIERLVQDFYDKLSSTAAALNSPHVPHELLESINAVFMGARVDFDFFASVNFEKRQPQSSPDGMLKKVGSLSTVSDGNLNGDSMNNFMGSGGESLESEDSFDHHDFMFDENDELDFETRSNNDSLDGKYRGVRKSSLLLLGNGQARLGAHLQPEQAKIVWSLLKESMSRAVSILNAHVEYSTRMGSIIAALSQSNQNSQAKAGFGKQSSLPSRQPFMQHHNNLHHHHISNGDLLINKKHYNASHQEQGNAFRSKQFLMHTNSSPSGQSGQHSFLQQMGPNGGRNGYSSSNNNNNNGHRFNNKAMVKPSFGSIEDVGNFNGYSNFSSGFSGGLPAYMNGSAMDKDASASTGLISNNYKNISNQTFNVNVFQNDKNSLSNGMQYQVGLSLINILKCKIVFVYISSKGTFFLFLVKVFYKMFFV